MKKSIIILSIIVLFLIIYLLQKNKNTTPIYNEIHIHTDFSIYLDGEKYNLQDNLYQSTNDLSRDRFLHLHENDGGVLHIHSKGQKFIKFLNSIGFYIKENCLTTYKNEEFCTNESKILRLFKITQKGKIKKIDINTYTPKDLDRVFLYYGIDDIEQIKKASLSVSSIACVYSGKCKIEGIENINETCTTKSNSSCSGVIVKPLKSKI